MNPNPGTPEQAPAPPAPATFVCPTHNETIEEGSMVGCSGCNAFLDAPTDAGTMTPQERIEELERWFGPMTVPFSRIHERVEALVGRPVWTHEMARPENLYAEIESGDHPENLRAHAIESLCDVAGSEKVFVYDVPPPTPSTPRGEG